MAQVDFDSELNALVASAIETLAKLNAESLEELALRCGELVREAEGAHLEWRLGQNDSRLVAFAKVIEASRANLKVFCRLDAMLMTRLGYGRSAETCAIGREFGSGQH